jgi:methionyl-tRNA synthetase
MPIKMKRLLDTLGVQPERRNYDHAKFGLDFDYGTPTCELGKTPDDSLFPPLTAES